MNVCTTTWSPGASPLRLLLLLSCRILLIRGDNLGTLRTYQRAGCDDNVVTLRCPPGTSISIELAQYGNSGPSTALCGAASSTEATDANTKTGDNTNISCLLSNAMQYSLLQTVVETCQKKPQCKFQTSPKTFGGDPCPGVRKYVEVAYKCRPYEFRSKIACENEKIQLKCNPNSRVAVYSASYGRTEYESIQCPQTQGVAEETCLVSYATETVMQICHGKRSCEISADAGTFGNPCQPRSRMYLKVVYTCVPRKVLKDQYEERPEPDELQSEFNAYDDDFDYEHYDTAGNEFIRESAASPPASSANDKNDGLGDDTVSNNFTRDSSVTSAKLPPHAKSKEGDKENRERFYLYLTLSVGSGVLLCLLMLVIRLLIQRHRDKRDAKFHVTNITDNAIPNGFADDISEVDADIDLTTTLPVPSGVAIHSPGTGTISESMRPGYNQNVMHTTHHIHPHHRHLHSNTGTMMSTHDAPRTLNTNTQYYYG